MARHDLLRLVTVCVGEAPATVAIDPPCPGCKWMFGRARHSMGVANLFECVIKMNSGDGSLFHVFKDYTSTRTRNREKTGLEIRHLLLFLFFLLLAPLAIILQIKWSKTHRESSCLRRMTFKKKGSNENHGLTIYCSTKVYQVFYGCSVKVWDLSGKSWSALPGASCSSRSASNILRCCMARLNMDQTAKVSKSCKTPAPEKVDHKSLRNTKY